ARRHRFSNARADSHGTSHEWENVGASRHSRKRGTVEVPRGRVHWTGRRNAGLWLRRRGAALESRRYRFSRRVSARASGQFDRVRFVITAGPTREPLDPVRYLSNRSSGKMGYAIAEAIIEAGNQAILISGPVNVSPPKGVELVMVSTSDEMY